MKEVVVVSNFGSEYLRTVKATSSPYILSPSTYID